MKDNTYLSCPICNPDKDGNKDFIAMSKEVMNLRKCGWHTEVIATLFCLRRQNYTVGAEINIIDHLVYLLCFKLPKVDTTPFWKPSKKKSQGLIGGIL